VDSPIPDEVPVTSATEALELGMAASIPLAPDERGSPSGL
jgi:hypothetical protein